VELTVAADRGVFSGPARVRRRDDDARALTVELLGALEAVQRRQYFRIDVALAAVTAAVFGPGGAPAGSVRAQVQNLSGGGLCFEGDRPLTREHSVALALALEEGPPLTVRCAVLEGAEVAPGRWRMRASFVGMPDRDRQRIVRQVQRLQLARERYRRGDGG
jgi:c-di-GMP-binding flagellar brake protein YcgR